MQKLNAFAQEFVFYCRGGGGMVDQPLKIKILTN